MTKDRRWVGAAGWGGFGEKIPACAGMTMLDRPSVGYALRANPPYSLGLRKVFARFL
jgi:hypothetical protein